MLVYFVLNAIEDAHVKHGGKNGANITGGTRATCYREGEVFRERFGKSLRGPSGGGCRRRRRSTSFRNAKGKRNGAASRDEISRAHVTAVNGRSTRQRGFPQSPRDPRGVLPVGAIATLPPPHSCLRAINVPGWPVIDPLANFQMLRRYGHDVMPDDGGRRTTSTRTRAAGITAGLPRAADGGVYIANE